MKLVTPSVKLVACTQINEGGFQEFLGEIGVPEWHSDAETGTELLIEAAGKTCYMSFDTVLNKNLTKTGTRNNFDYIQQGIIGTKHGSVLEHGVVTFAFINVSRVFTHELVRHRAGAAYSQTSGRYVRLDELPFWIPSCINDDLALAAEFEQAVMGTERHLRKMVEISGIDRMTTKEDFPRKKTLTSAFRRVIGNGVANNIIATFNHRGFRNIIELRTSRHAEEEIRLGVGKAAELVFDMFPAIYADVHREMVDSYWEYTFPKASKV